jgi:hypothetical protein
MDIHKPKSWHSAREFLKEYVIIVVGVLTALGAEQAVEWLHWRERVSEADRAITAELQIDAALASERVALHQCLVRQLTTLETELASDREALHVTPRTVPMLGERVYIPPVRVWLSEAWQRAVADGTANHFDHARALALGNLYRQIEDTAIIQNEEFAVTQEVNALRHFHTLPQPERRAFLVRLQRVQDMESLMSGGGLQIIDHVRELGVKRDRALLIKGLTAQNRQWGFCGPDELDFTDLKR